MFEVADDDWPLRIRTAPTGVIENLVTLHMVNTTGMLSAGHSHFEAVVPRIAVMRLLAPLDGPVVVTNATEPAVNYTSEPEATRLRTDDNVAPVPTMSAKMFMLCAGRIASRKRV